MDHLHRAGKARDDKERLRVQDDKEDDNLRRDRKEPGRRLAIRRENIRPQRAEEEEASNGEDLKTSVKEKLPKKKELKSSRRGRDSSPVQQGKAREQERRITIHSDSSSDRPESPPTLVIKRTASPHTLDDRAELEEGEYVSDSD